MMNSRRFPKNKAPKSRKHTVAFALPEDAASERAAKIARVESSSNEKKTMRRRKDGRAFVQKNSLTEAKLIEARDKASAEGNWEEERRAANRLSSFQSRQRKKEIIQELEGVVTELSEHNKTQATTIKGQKDEILALRQENLRLQDLAQRREKELASLKMQQEILPTSVNPLARAKLLDELQRGNQLRELLRRTQNRKQKESESRRLAELLNLAVNHHLPTSLRTESSMMVGYDGPITTPSRRVSTAEAAPTDAQLRALLHLTHSNEQQQVRIPSPSQSSRRNSLSSNSESSESTMLSYLRSHRVGHSHNLS